MPERFYLQASGCMFGTLEPDGWCAVFGVVVTDENGAPVSGLTKPDFAVWGVHDIGSFDLYLATEIGVDIPSTDLIGVYRLQTKDFLPSSAPKPQEYVFAIRVHPHRKRGPAATVTVPVTWLGPPA